jgi:hypothetical protein
MTGKNNKEKEQMKGKAPRRDEQKKVQKKGKEEINK